MDNVITRGESMAVATIPKSEIRVNNSITVGYATVPATETEDGELAWGLPGRVLTTNKQFATEFCSTLNDEIVRRMRSPKQLLTTR